jgi:hypothetical protein
MLIYPTNFVTGWYDADHAAMLEYMYTECDMHLNITGAISLQLPTFRTSASVLSTHIATAK